MIYILSLEVDLTNVIFTSEVNINSNSACMTALYNLSFTNSRAIKNSLPKENRKSFSPEAESCSVKFVKSPNRNDIWG